MFKASLAQEEFVATVLELAKVYHKLDLPNTAVRTIGRSLVGNPGEVRLLLGLARVYEMLQDTKKAAEIHHRVRQMLLNIRDSAVKERS